MYTLNYLQWDIDILVGIFATEKEVLEYIDRIPFIKKVEDTVGGNIYEDFIMEYDDVPEYYEFEYNGLISVITNKMFDPDETIDVIWQEVEYFTNPKETNRYVIGDTKVDAYVIPTQDVKEYIESREKAALEIREYFEEKGYPTIRCFQGSEDGEAIAALKNKDEIESFVYLDPTTVDAYLNGRLKEYIKEVTEL